VLMRCVEEGSYLGLLAVLMEGRKVHNIDRQHSIKLKSYLRWLRTGGKDTRTDC